MAKVSGIPSLQVTIHLELSEGEARALLAIAGYGDDNVIRAIRSGISTNLVDTHEKDIRSFMKSIRSGLQPPLAGIDSARRAFSSEILARST